MKRLSEETQTRFRTIINYSSEAQTLLKCKEFVERFEPYFGSVSYYSTENGIVEQLNRFRQRTGFIYLFVVEQTFPTLTIGWQKFPVVLTYGKGFLWY